MSSEQIYAITGGAPEYLPRKIIIKDNIKVGSDGTDEEPNTDFDNYLKKIHSFGVTLGAYEGEGSAPALIVGGRLDEHFVSKSASTVEQDIREMFGYKHAIKPKIRRRIPRVVSKKQRQKNKDKKRKKKKHGGSDSNNDNNNINNDIDNSNNDSNSNNNINNDIESASENALNDYENASILEFISNEEEYEGASEAAAKGVFCTLVMNGDNYIPGATVLARSVHENSEHEIYCMYTNDVSADGVKTLNEHFDKCILVPYIEHDSTPLLSEKQRAIYGGWINKSYTKWNIFNHDLFPYDKVIFIDADIVLLAPIDDLFDLDCDVAATFSSPWVRPYSNRGFNPYYHERELEHGETILHSDLKLGLYEYGIVGLASIVLVTPDNDIFKSITSILDSKSVYGYNCVSGHDEQLLADVILKNNLIAVHIHQKYNWNAGKTQWLSGKKPLVVHYYNKDKPWNRPLVYSDEKYWNDYADALLEDYPNTKVRLY